MTDLTPTDRQSLTELDTILFRLAATDDDNKLIVIIHRLLPRILPICNNNVQQIRQKLIQIIEHVNTRMKTLTPEQQYRCVDVAGLVQLYVNTGSDDSVLYTTMLTMFMDKWFAYTDTTQQSSPAAITDRQRYGAQLMQNIHRRPVQQQYNLLYIFTQTLNSINYVRIEPDTLTELYTFVTNAADKRVVLQYFTEILLYTTAVNTSKDAQKQAAQSISQPSNNTATPAAAPAVSVPDGMSLNGVQLLLSTNKQSIDYTAFKLNILNWLNWVPTLTDVDVLPLALIGTVVGSDAVNKVSDDIVRKCGKLVDYENTDFVKQLMTLYLGNADSKTLEANDKRTPINVHLKVKVVNLLAKSTYAATLTAQSLRVIFDGMFAVQAVYKLKQAALQYASHFINKATITGLTQIGAVMLNGLLKFLSMHSKSGDSAITATANIEVGTGTGTDAMPDAPTAEKTLSSSIDHYVGQLRGITYSLLGQLGYRIPTLVNTNTKILQLYFNALATEHDDQVLQNIHEGLSLLRNAYADSAVGGNVQHELDAMLMQATDSNNRRVRLNAIQCTNKLFPFDHVSSRYACLLLSNDTSVEVRDEAKRGLTPFVLRDHKLIQQQQNSTATHVDTPATPTDAANNAAASPTATTPSPTKPTKALLKPIVHVNAPYPVFDTMMQYVYTRLADELGTTTGITDMSHLSGSYKTPPKLLENTILFLYATLESNAAFAKRKVGAEMTDKVTVKPDTNAIQQFTHLIEYTIQSPTSDTQIVAAATLHKLVSANPTYFAPIYSRRLDWLKKYLFSNVREIRLSMASILTVVAERFDASTLHEMLKELYSQLQQSNGSHTISQQDMVHGSILGIGVTVAELIKPTRAHTAPSDDQRKLIREAVCQLVDRLTPEQTKRDTSLVAATCVSVARIAQSNELPLPLVADVDMADITDVAKPVASRTDYTRYAVTTRLLALAKGTERKLHRLTEEAVTAVSHIGANDSNALLVKYILLNLFQLSNSKFDELHFVVGDGLAVIGNRKIELVSRNSTENELLEKVIKSLKLTDSMKDVLKLLTFDQPDAALASVQSPVMYNTIRVVVDRLLDNGNQLQRYSSVIWLLSIIKYNALNAAVVHSAVYLQDALIRRGLTDKSVLSQECAGKAISLLYQSSSPETQKQLVTSIQHRFGIGVKTDLVVESNSAEQLASSEFDTVDHTSTDEYSTYKELTQIAHDMGNISLMYQFLDIASSHSLVLSHLHDRQDDQDSKQAAATSDMFSSTTPKQLQALVPRLYRYIHDSSEKIRHVMSMIWNTVVDRHNGSLAVINEHYTLIMDDLVQKVNSKNTRVRFSCVSGIAELLYGRSFDEVNKYMSELWMTTFRLLDDVNDDIRKGSQTLATQLHNLTVRLTDPTYTNNKSHITRTLDIVVPIMLNTGVTHRVQECQQLSLKTLLQIIKHAQRYLSPYLADIILVLLESFSSSENAQLQYLQFHAANYNLTDDQLENARINVARNSPYNDALVSCIQLIDSTNIHAVVTKLIEILRHGIGIPTLTAAARAVVTICQSNISGQIANDTAQLIRVLQNGLTDSSITVRKLYANALSYVLRVSKPDDIQKCLQYVTSLYDGENRKTTTIIEATDVNRLSAGYTCQLIVQHISDELRSYVNEPIATLSYIAMHDGSKDVEAQWRDNVWNEINPSSESGANNYADSIVQRSLHYLTSTAISYQLKAITVLALIDLVKATKANFTKHVQAVMSLCVQLLPGRLWTGKYHLLQLISTIITECHAYMIEADTDVVYCAIDCVVNEAVNRNKIEYKREAIRAIGLISLQYPAYIKLDVLRPTFDSILSTAAKDGDIADAATDSKRDTDMTDTAEFKQTLKTDVVLQSYAYDAIGQMWPKASYNPFVDGALSPNSPPAWYNIQHTNWRWYMDTVVNGYVHAGTHTIRAAVLRAMKRYIENTWLGVRGVALEPCMGEDQCDRLINTINAALHDSKYSVVRDGGMEALVAVLHRFELHKFITQESIDLMQATLAGASSDTSATVLRHLSHAKSALAGLIEDRQAEQMTE